MAEAVLGLIVIAVIVGIVGWFGLMWEERGPTPREAMRMAHEEIERQKQKERSEAEREQKEYERMRTLSEARPRVPVAECPVPGCGGTIVERPKTYGCDSWKSPSNRGCGYVIWKRPRGSERDMTVEEAKARIEADRADPEAAGLEPVIGGRGS